MGTQNSTNIRHEISNKLEQFPKAIKREKRRNYRPLEDGEVSSYPIFKLYRTNTEDHILLEAETPIHGLRNFGMFPVKVIHEILLYLLPRDLIRAFRVCKLFQSVGFKNYWWKDYYQFFWNEIVVENVHHSCTIGTLNWRKIFIKRFKYHRSDSFYRDKLKRKNPSDIQEEMEVSFVVFGTNHYERNKFVEIIGKQFNVTRGIDFVNFTIFTQNYYTDGIQVDEDIISEEEDVIFEPEVDKSLGEDNSCIRNRKNRNNNEKRFDVAIYSEDEKDEKFFRWFFGYDYVVNGGIHKNSLKKEFFEKHQSTEMYPKVNVDGIFFIFNIDDRKSYEEMKILIDEKLNEFNSPQIPPVLLIGIVPYSSSSKNHSFFTVPPALFCEKSSEKSFGSYVSDLLFGSKKKCHVEFGEVKEYVQEKKFMGYIECDISSSSQNSERIDDRQNRNCLFSFGIMMDRMFHNRKQSKQVKNCEFGDEQIATRSDLNGMMRSLRRIKRMTQLMTIQAERSREIA